MVKIFVVHYDKLTERKNNIINQMKKCNLEFEFVSNYGKDVLTDEDKKMFRNLSDGEISVALHHIQCFKLIAEKYNYALILEDDAILHKKFTTALNCYIKLLPDDWDMLFIGSGCNLHVNPELIVKGKHIYKQNVGHSSTRCLDSYLISNKCAKLIVEKLQIPNYTIIAPADFWLNHVIKNNNLNIYWAEPTIVKQGSENGLFNSVLR
jgi:glycosyl transferase family 25